MYMSKYVHSTMAFAAVSLSTLLLSACGNRHSERAPPRVASRGLTTNERLELQAKLNNRLSTVNDVLRKLDQVIALAQTVEKPKLGFDVYTPLDLLLDATEGFKRRLPEGRRVGGSERFSVPGRLRVPQEILWTPCEIIETLLQGEFNDDDGVIVYKLKTCEAPEFLEIARIETTSSSLRFALHRVNAGKILKELTRNESFPLAYNCRIGLEQGMPDSFDCGGILIELNESEALYFARIGISGFAKSEVGGRIQIYVLENWETKDIVEVKLVPGKAPTFTRTPVKAPPEDEAPVEVEPAPTPSPLPSPSPTPAPSPTLSPSPESTSIEA